jgi:Family of unknown function (DUF5715)
MGESTKAEYSLAATGDKGRVQSALPDVLLPGYRAAVEDLVEEANSHRGPAGPPVVEKLFATRLEQPEITAVLAYLDGGADSAADRLRQELRHYEPSARTSASDLPTFLRILLLSQIDSAWWSGTVSFNFDADVLDSAELLDLDPLRSAKVLEFQYRPQPAGLPGRARDWARHKVLPSVRPRVAGMRFTRSRPAVLAVVNQVAREFAAAAAPRTPRPWVTSMARSVQHQHRLRSLGYAAVLPSSHCAGYACDLEMVWFRRFDPDNVLARLLYERQEAGQVNVIDEGQALHFCVSPLACDELQAAYDDQRRGRK